MKPDDWAALKMLPPSENHDAFHQYLNLNGSLSPAGMALLKLADVLVQESAERVTAYQRKWGNTRERTTSVR
jgi:hypothetical protein